MPPPLFLVAPVAGLLAALALAGAELHHVRFLGAGGFFSHFPTR
jgi:hypothetical protein